MSSLINNVDDVNANDVQKQKENRHLKALVFMKSLLAGGVAGAVSRTVVSPLERLKILFQLNHSSKRKNGIVKNLLQIYKEEGMLGYFRGNGTNIIRIIPYSAVQFATYDTVKRMILIWGDGYFREDSAMVKLISGAMAGIASVTVTYPLDLVRTRLSMSGDVPRGISECIRQVCLKEGGVVALYRGIIPTIVGIAPYVALNFTTYETLKSFLLKKSDNFGELPIYVRLGCGGVAGAVAQSCTYPLDVLRRRMQVSQTKSSSIELFRKIYRIEGWRAFYRGMLPNLLKVVPAISTSFVMYEWCISNLNKIM